MKEPPSREYIRKLATVEPAPKEGEIIGSIGQYRLIRSIGKGGMGEVFLAYDTECGRRVALKRIREDLHKHPQLEKRFLKEALVTSQLSHPAIIPIYRIERDQEHLYYTMPYVEGSTLKEILKVAKQEERNPRSKKNPHTSIAALLRIFLQVSQAIAFAHSKGVLHRDIKPENIIVGTYGEVVILDWGLAKILHRVHDSKENDEKDLEESLLSADPRTPLGLTRVGKIVGTISYMAPERAMGLAATHQTDIYSLGVILYQILTLSFPFKRKNLKAFKENWKHEQLIAPEVKAPYRDVPQILSEIVKRCLAKEPRERYASVDELVQSLENYLEGRSEWFIAKELDVKRASDWKFQEHIFLAEHTAITKSTEASDWVYLMISKGSYNDNILLQADVRIAEGGHGIGFLFSIPEIVHPQDMTEGYCLWIKAKGALDTHAIKQKTKLLRSSVSVYEAPEIELTTDTWHEIRIEKIDNHINFYLDKVLQFSYINLIPIVGTHVGLLSRDADYEIKNFKVSIGSQNIMVNCLAVPDAFLAAKDYERALLEYRRIGASFSGRAEGREALFRAGITLLEKALDQPDEFSKAPLYDEALSEFGLLRKTPGAPLEYLGKALVYKTMKEYEEEAKCFEIALRRYPHHPLLKLLEEQMVFRMHESAKQNRVAAYNFISLVVRFLPDSEIGRTSMKLFMNLYKHWEPLPFIKSSFTENEPDLFRLSFSMQLGFWLAKPFIIIEMVHRALELPVLPLELIVDGFFMLAELGAASQMEEEYSKIVELLSEREQKRHSELLKQISDLILISQGRDLSEDLEGKEGRILAYAIKRCISTLNFDMGRSLAEQLSHFKPKNYDPVLFDSHLVEMLLFSGDIEFAKTILHRHSRSELQNERSPLFFFSNCIEASFNADAVEEKFTKLLDFAFPRTQLLAAHFLGGKIYMTSGWWQARSFMWERRSLYKGLALFYKIIGKEEMSQAMLEMESKEYSR